MSQMIATDGEIVSSLLTRWFGSRTANEKNIIIQEGRPMPEFEIKTNDRVFQNDWYVRKDWLCGSDNIALTTLL